MDFERRYDTPKELHERFELKRRIGKGSYGTVYEAVDRTDGDRVAIKCQERVFNTNTDALRTLREISILRQCRHPNILSVKTVLTPPTRDFRDIWVVCGHGGWDLSRIIKHHETVQGWAPLHIKFIVYQLLCALRYMQSANLVHRDLKPSNILLNEACDVTLIDFGLARQLGETPPEEKGRSLGTVGTAAGPMRSSSANSAGGEGKRATSEEARPAPAAFDSIPAAPVKMVRQLTHHVVTRWYRAPELIVMDDTYGNAVDMWSVGCIFGELLQTVEKHVSRPRPLFPGDGCYPLSDRRDYDDEDDDDMLAEIEQDTHQLSRILKVIGSPSESEIESVQHSKFRRVLRRMKRYAPQDLVERFPSAEADAVDLLYRMLTFDPKKRITVIDALDSPYFAEIRQPEKEVLATSPIVCNVERDPTQPHHRERERLRRLLLEEIAHHHVGEEEEKESGASTGRGGEGKMREEDGWDRIRSGRSDSGAQRHPFSRDNQAPAASTNETQQQHNSKRCAVH